MSHCKQHSPEFKAMFALEALKDEETASELVSRFGVQPPAMIYWQRIERYQPHQQVQRVIKFTTEVV